MDNLVKNLRKFDAYPKTLEDFRVRTFSGAAELFYYLSTEVTPELYVDTTRGEKLRINMDIVFHNLPCSYLSLDAMDISGEHQLDVAHNIFKKRLRSDGSVMPAELGDDSPSVKVPEANYCGSCYGAEPTPGYCCNTCEQVQETYRKKGWAFTNADSIEQGFTEKLREQIGEGCQVYGYLLVNKVAGNFHIAPGKSFQQQHMHVHDLQPFKNAKFDLSHSINRLSFGREFPGIVNPLDGVTKENDRNIEGAGMYQYFIKVVPTTYEHYSGSVLNTNQFSVTEHFKPISGGSHGLPGDHIFLSLTTGVFFMYELSPIMVKFQEHRRSFAHFLTGVCAIVGGVFTVAGLVDSFIYTGMRSLKKKVELGKAS